MTFALVRAVRACVREGLEPIAYASVLSAEFVLEGRGGTGGAAGGTLVWGSLKAD